MVRNMGTLVVALTLWVAVACGTANPGSAVQNAAPVSPGDSSISANEAPPYIGQEAKVCGRVVDSRYAQTSRGSPTFLNFDRPYPNHVFTVVIWGSDRGSFPSSPETYYRGKRVCASGLIEPYQGKPQIVAMSDSQLEVER
jgi:hypothetical protein